MHASTEKGSSFFIKELQCSIVQQQHALIDSVWFCIQLHNHHSFDAIYMHTCALHIHTSFSFEMDNNIEIKSCIQSPWSLIAASSYARKVDSYMHACIHVWVCFKRVVIHCISLLVVVYMHTAQTHCNGYAHFIVYKVVILVYMQQKGAVYNFAYNIWRFCCLRTAVCAAM